MSAVSQGLSPLESYRELTDFARRCGENALRLAMHAAVAQSFRADLLHLLKLNFLPDAVRDPAVEADVLLAPFTEDLSGGYYEFDTEARRQLLDRLDAAHPQRNGTRLKQVARFLAGYAAHEEERLEASADPLRRDYLEIQRWVSLAHFDPDSAARQLAYALDHVEESGRAAVRLQIGGLIRSLSAPLAAHRMLERLGPGEVQVAGFKLRPVDAVLSEWKSRLEPATPGAGLRVEHATILIVTEAASNWSDEPLYQRWVQSGFHPQCLSMKEVVFSREAEALAFVSGRDAGFLILDERFLDLEQQRVSAILGLPSLPLIPLWRPRWLAKPDAREQYLSHRLQLGWLANPIETDVGPDIHPLEEEVQGAVAAIRRWVNAPENGLDVARQQLAFFRQYNPGSEDELRARVGSEVRKARSAANELLARSDLAGARGLLEKALAAQTEAAGAETGETYEVQADLAQALAALGEFQRSRALWEPVLAGAQKLAAKSLEITALAGLGEIHANLGNKEEGVAFLLRASAMSVEIADPRAARIRALLERLKPEPPVTAPSAGSAVEDPRAQQWRPKPQTGQQVFIAYAYRDRDVASAIAGYLEKSGIGCWIAPRDIQPGVDWANEVRDAIKGSGLLVVILSRASSDARSVIEEVRLAEEAEKIVIPFLIDPSIGSSELGHFLRKLHWFDATSDWQSQVPKLVNEIQAWLDRAPSEQASSAAGAPGAPVPAQTSTPRVPVGQPGNIFVSFARADYGRVEPLLKALAQLGLPLLWDPMLPSGRNTELAIEQALRTARCVLVVWTLTSINSEYVNREAAEGLRRGILIPVLLDEVKMPLSFRSIQAAKLVGWSGDTTEAEFERLVQSISARVSAPAVGASPTTKKKASLGERIRGWFTGDSGKEAAASDEAAAGSAALPRPVDKKTPARGGAVPASSAPPGPAKVFVSYAHQDQALSEEFLKFLSPLQHAGILEIWQDREIRGGDPWQDEIIKRLVSADLIILLVSPDFLASSYLYDVEMKRVFERFDSGEAAVVPVILRPCLWEETRLREMQALPRYGRAVTEQANRDKAWMDVINEIRDVVRDLRGPRSRMRPNMS